ncbi:MAG: HAD hydrolase-like protein, partial [Myxococcota bacterium]
PSRSKSTVDGVLVDSVPPIRASMNHALVRLGRAPRSEADIRPLIGPPLERSAAIALGTEDADAVAAFVDHFRTSYAERYLVETQPAHGLGDVLAALAARYRLLVATSKPEAYAVPLLRHLGVDGWFEGIFGRSLALDHDSKAQVIGRALAAIDEPLASRILIVGDREHDVHGASAHGIATVGVRHGAGDEAELREAGAIHIVDDLPALRAWLRGGSST